MDTDGTGTIEDRHAEPTKVWLNGGSDDTATTAEQAVDKGPPFAAEQCREILHAGSEDLLRDRHQSDGALASAAAPGHGPLDGVLQTTRLAENDGASSLGPEDRSSDRGTEVPQTAGAAVDSPTTATSEPAVEISPSTKEATTPVQATSSPHPSNEDDVKTMNALMELKNEHGLRPAKPKQEHDHSAETPGSSESIENQTLPAAAKRKTVPATKKRPAKKRKLAIPSVGRGSALLNGSSRTSSPLSRNSRFVTPLTQDDGAQSTKSFNDGEDESGSDADSGLFCICRRPDDCTYMIACDAGCNDWYHGKCVQISAEDGELIESYTCAQCQSLGRRKTMWKPICRRHGCRRPARVQTKQCSKYCSDDCGLTFFQSLANTYDSAIDDGRNIAGTAKSRPERPKARFGSRPTNNSNLQKSGPVDSDSRGNAINVAELKALVDSVTSAGSFQTLGNLGGAGTSGLTPLPTIADFAHDLVPLAQESSVHEAALSLPKISSGDEDERLAEVRSLLRMFRQREQNLKDQEEFVFRLRDNAVKYVESEGYQAKNVCAFDTRISWSEAEFLAWRTSPAGVLFFNGKRTDSIPSEQPTGEGPTSLDSAGLSTKQICVEKRCERHRHWLKVAVGNFRCEEENVTAAIHRLENEERDILISTLLRHRERFSQASTAAGEVVIVAK